MSDVFAEESTSSVPQTARRQNSNACLFGCLGAVVAVLALSACAGFGAYFFVVKQVDRFTSTTPKDLPTVQYSPEQLKELESKIEQFQASLKGPSTDAAAPPTADSQVAPPDADSQDAEATAAAPTDATDAQATGETSEDPSRQPMAARQLVLTADDINALIAKNEAFRKRVFVRISDGKITGDISVPIDRLLPGLRGRYLNASATFDVTLQDGVLIVTIADAEAKGQKLPEQVLEALRKENLAKDIYRDPENARMIRRIESVKVEDDRVIATLRDPEDAEK